MSTLWWPMGSVLRRSAPWLSVLGLSVVGLTACGGAEEPAPTPAAVADTTGGEEAAPPRPTGPPRSYVADEDTVVMRLDMSRVRESALSNDIASLVRSYPTWSELLGNSGIDPVRDFDRVLVTAPTAVTGRGTMLIRHRLTETQVREAVLNMAVDRGERPEWREVDGFDVVDWPAETDPPRVVVLTGDRELVVTTPDDVERVIEVAADHRARREGDAIVEPALELADGTIATVVAEQLSDYAQSRMQHPPEAFELELREDAEQEGRLALSARGTYPDADAAEAARRYYAGQRDFYADQMLVRAVGLDRPLREAQIAAEGEQLALDASFTEEEIQRVLGLVALGQLGGMGGG